MNRNFIPKVNPSREFLEIASDFSNPLDLVREAISNAFDAKASRMDLSFTTFQEHGRPKLKILIRDNGSGMNYEDLNSFFDLGNSKRVHQKDYDPSLIGEKGHGTKIYFNSEQIGVVTGKDGKKYECHMRNPIGCLYDGYVPEVEVIESDELFEGTLIEIIGYNGNERYMFKQEQLQDYILWFTKFGSFEQQFDEHKDLPHQQMELYLQGIDVREAKKISFGHIFAMETMSLDRLLDDHLADAPDRFVKRFRHIDRLPNFPEIEYQAVFYIEGNKAKREYNPMIKRSGYRAPDGAYTVQERYGLWLSKDFIPVQKKNDWIGSKGTEFTRLHAFFNCQALKLTANRGSIDNTPADILSQVQKEVERLYRQITESDDWANIDYLTRESDAYQSERREKNDLDKRIKQSRSAKTAEFKGIVLREPRQEQGVFSIYRAIDVLEPQLFPFDIIDYDTHAGIDVLAQLRNSRVHLDQSMLRYVEFKYLLNKNFNHSFNRLYGIVCWQIKILHDEVVNDAFGTPRKLRIVPRSGQGSFTQYFLEDERDPHRIEIIVLEEYLSEKLGIQFRRTR